MRVLSDCTEQLNKHNVDKGAESHLKLIEPLDSWCEAEVAHITSKRRLPVLQHTEHQDIKVNSRLKTDALNSAFIDISIFTPFISSYRIICSSYSRINILLE